MSARILRKLLDSAVFQRPLPARRMSTQAAWAGLDEQARREALSVGVEAIRLVPEFAPWMPWHACVQQW